MYLHQAHLRPWKMHSAALASSSVRESPTILDMCCNRSLALCQEGTEAQVVAHFQTSLALHQECPVAEEKGTTEQTWPCVRKTLELGDGCCFISFPHGDSTVCFAACPGLCHASAHFPWSFLGPSSASLGLSQSLLCSLLLSPVHLLFSDC